MTASEGEMEDAPDLATPGSEDHGGRPPGPRPLRTPRVDAALAASGDLRVWLDDDFDDRAAPSGWRAIASPAVSTCSTPGALSRAIRRYAGQIFDVDESRTGGQPHFTFRARP